MTARLMRARSTPRPVGPVELFSYRLWGDCEFNDGITPVYVVVCWHGSGEHAAVHYSCLTVSGHVLPFGSGCKRSTAGASSTCDGGMSRRPDNRERYSISCSRAVSCCSCPGVDGRCRVLCSTSDTAPPPGSRRSSSTMPRNHLPCRQTKHILCIGRRLLTSRLALVETSLC